MYRVSSPGWYSRSPARSTPEPRNRLRYSPWSRPSRRRMTVQSRRWRTRSGAGDEDAMVTQRDGGCGDAVEDGGQDAVGGDVLVEGLVREHEPVAHHVGGHVEHVVGEDVLAAAKQREGAGGEDEVDRRPGARPVRDEPCELGHAEPPRRPGRDREP